MLNNGSSSTLKDFDTLGKLGQGSFGVVYKVKRIIDGNIYVMKQINISKMNSRMKQDAINEVHILSKMNNPYVVRYYDSFIDKNVLCIIMEYCDSGDLSTFLKSQLGRPLQEIKIWKYFIMSCMGLDYIHRKKILHRDIKAMNIFLNKDDSLRIGDLGVAKVLSDQGNFAHTMVGTPFYLSPEMCEEKPYNEKSDIWSLGCVLYELCTYRHPFEANNQGALVLRIIRGKYNPIPTSYSKDLVSMVDMCLCRDYKKRPNARDILQTQIVLGKANQLGIELDYTKVKQKEINYQQKKDVSANMPSVPSTPSTNKNLIDKQREKNNALLNPNKPISHSPSSHNVQATAAQQKAKDDLVKKMQQDERDLNKKVEQKLIQQNIQQIQNNDKKYKDRIQELYKKEEQLKMQQKQELERQKQTEQVLQMQKKREEQMKKEEERKLLEKKKKDAEKKKEEDELRKKKELEKQKQEKAAAAAAAISQQQQIIKEKEDQIKNEFKIRQNGFDPRVNQASQQQQVNQIERFSPKQSDSKKQLFGNQMQNNFNKQVQQVQQQPPSQFGYQKQQIEKKKDIVSERKESIKPKEDDRKNIQRIRKGAPTGLGNIAKNPLSYGYKDVRQSKDERPSDFSYEQDQDRQEVYNLPDNVHKQRNAPKSAQPYKPTVNDLRNIASQGFEENTSKFSSQRESASSSQVLKSQNDQRIVDQKRLNRPQQGKLPSVESFDSSFEDSPNKHISVQSASSLQKQTQEDNDIQKAIQNQDLNRPHTGQLKEKLYYNKPFVNKEVTDKYEKELQKQNIQQIVNDSFIDKEFGSSSENDKKTKQNAKKSDKKQNLENTQFEFIPIPKAKELNDWNDKMQQNNENSQQQLSSEEEEEDDNKLGDEYFKSQTINRGQLDLPDDMGGADDDDDEDEEEEQKNDDKYNEEEEYDQYYQEEEEQDEDDQNQSENSQDNDQDIESIPDQNDWQKDEEEDEYEDDQENEYEQQSAEQYNKNKYEQDEYEEQSYEQSTSSESSLQKREIKKRDLEQKLQARLKRQNELQTLLDIKVYECHKVLGEQKFNVILQFFKNKLNCEKELTDEDQDEIDQMMQENMKNITNNQVIHNFYKILHLDIELEKCKSDVRSIQQNMQQL